MLNIYCSYLVHYRNTNTQTIRSKDPRTTNVNLIIAHRTVVAEARPPMRSEHSADMFRSSSRAERSVRMSLLSRRGETGATTRPYRRRSGQVLCNRMWVMYTGPV